MKKATLGPAARIPRWFVVIGAIALILTSCAGLPSPSGREPALLVILVEDSGGAHQVHFERHSTGLREIELSPSTRPGLSGGGPDAPASVQLNLRPNSVTLFPYLVEEYSRGLLGGGQPGAARVIRPVSDAERRAVAEHLTDHVRFYEWVGGSYYGFGSYAALLGRTTDRFRVFIDSDPRGAEVAIDAESAGRTPLTLQLPAGRYLADLSAEAHDPARLVLDISSDTELMVELPERSETEAPQLSEYGLVIQRFATLVPNEDDLFTVPFGTSLETVLAQDERILVLAAGHLPVDQGLSSGNGSAAAGMSALFAPHRSSAAPDFAFAESRGAELILAGYYTTREQELFVNATLYDVRTRGVKTNTVLLGRGGLQLFTTVDEMAAELSAAVDRVLPARSEAGTASAELVTAELTGTERRTAERDVVLQRNSRPHILGLSAAFGGPPGIGGVDGADGRRYGRMDGPTLQGALLYTRQFSANLGLAGGVSYSRNENSFGTELVEPAVDLAVTLAPEFIFGGTSVDLYLRPGLEYRYGFPVSIRFDDRDPDTDEDVRREFELGPYRYLSAFIETGVRYYFQRRFSQPAPFVYGALVLYPASYWFEAEQEEDQLGTNSIDSGLWLTAGMGLRL